ncbi:MAG: 4Fe-4S dicluster domain-containing protein [Deltaproteobacteria bacterium]|nr:4Fe-4S dicluster domain-containing protein [Deltaproteobacteria bacterium]
MMKIKGWHVTDTEWRNWLEALLQDGKSLIAPVEQDNLRLFFPVASAAEISLSNYLNTQWSPKEFLFPRSEPLVIYRFRGNETELEDPELDGKEQVLFALRPCDVAGLARLDDMFLGEGADPFYEHRRRQTTIVSLACDEARAECFCTAVGGSPGGTEGSDIQMIPHAGAWLLRALTAKGEELIAASATTWKPASAQDWKKAEEQRQAVEKSIERRALSKEWAPRLEESFSQPLWEKLGQRCLGCGICAYVCPSCSCFDMNDEGNASCGTRCRSWDSCAFSRFTRHASGHNPRASQPLRFRQRVLHKFSYFPMEHGERFMCVGCGRCLKLCPVGLDIHQSVQSAVSAGTTEEGQQ